jgi:hypothetical protein
MPTTIKNTNICLEVISKHVASPFNPTCLPRLSCTECVRTALVERGYVIDGPIHKRVVLRYSGQECFIWYCNTLLFQYLLCLISYLFHLDVSA